MRISLIAVITSVFALNAYANTVLTSQTYVDNADAQKVDIAQGVGTNNANVGKTLVVNSSGNLELGTVSAGNYVEDSITDGVTNKAPSENAVHDALANKQNTIPATGTNSSTPGSTVVTYTGTAGQIGERGIYDGSTTYDAYDDADKLVTAGVVNNNPQTSVTYKTCARWIDGQSHTDENCLLWNLRDAPIRARQCYSGDDCGGYGYSCGGMCRDGICVDGIC